ncbi:hypothetical protein LX73_0028 [Fodinibius salinus]|uniref:Uncharacterized protein n=1 Tax=Fodinibius salinus TaxID=860790 RepID=A0A5D3YLI7_9BACT|nr:hypothetical protein [Fodinibius salinus]TYP94740.1 hypothetical protein LX73_0028 [Fodinibius salinus]
MSTSPLTLDLFTQVQSDFESSQYKILAGLKSVSKEFKNNKIYPHLSHLVELYSTLSDILNQLQGLRDKFPKRIKKIDFINEKIEHEVIFVPGADINRVEELIEWGLPYIKDHIEEGKTIFEFVDDEINLEKVGIVPGYTDEGYFFVPDNEESRLLLFQYEVTVFESAKDKYRSLKTTFKKAIEKGKAHRSPNAIKLELINENEELPNPATYAFNTDLYFPFRETIFPVTKRKLLQQLFKE